MIVTTPLWAGTKLMVPKELSYLFLVILNDFQFEASVYSLCSMCLPGSSAWLYLESVKESMVSTLGVFTIRSPDI